MKMGRIPWLVLLAIAPAGVLHAQDAVPSAPGRYRVEIRSSVDGSLQPSYLSLPTPTAAPAPLMVMLHTWSFDAEQRDSTVEREARDRGWLLLAPNFRGPNNHPEACGSDVSQQDILDAVAWTRQHYQVDDRRIYLLGMSGGGYMTMLMAARHPDPWAAASAWVGISDFRDWYVVHQADEYGAMVRSCFGGGPEISASTAAAFRARSPLTYLHEHWPVPLDLAAGRFDSTVAFSQTLRAFQAIAPGIVSDEDIAALLGAGPGLPHPTIADTATDPLLGRRLFLRRKAGASRVSIFDGGHEWLPSAAVAWLADHRKP